MTEARPYPAAMKCRWKECGLPGQPSPPCDGAVAPQLMRLRGEESVMWFCAAHGPLWLELAAAGLLGDDEHAIALTEDEVLAASVMLR